MVNLNERLSPACCVDPPGPAAYRRGNDMPSMRSATRQPVTLR
jgi:hypothetical protein